MKNQNKNRDRVIVIAKVTAKTVISAFFFSIALVGGATPALANGLVGQESAIINRTNQIRAEAGLPALRVDERLVRSASAKAADMAERGYFTHATPEGNRMNYWIIPAGYIYSLAGENIAKGYSSLDRLMNAWAGSPSHYRNLVEPRFTDIGIGMVAGWYEGQITLFVVQHFGVEANLAMRQMVELASSMAPLIKPLVEQVAGTIDERPSGAVSRSQAIIPLDTSGLMNESIGESVQLAAAIPVSTGGSPSSNLLWPLWAVIILATMGYIADERFILLIQSHFSRRSRSRL